MLAQAGDRREGGEVLDVGQVARELLGDALDQEVAEADAGQALLAVGDRIEDRRVGALRDRCVSARASSRRCTLPAMPSTSATSTKISGSSGMRGWKKAKQRRSEVEPVLEVAPRADGVHRLVVDQLLQQRRRGLPVDAHQVEEADIEPGAEQRPQVFAQRPRRGVALAQGQKLGAQVDHELHALRHADELAQQVHGRRLERADQGARRLLGGAPALDRGHRRLARQAVVVGERQQEFLAAGRRQRQIGLPQLRRARRAAPSRRPCLPGRRRCGSSAAGCRRRADRAAAARPRLRALRGRFR